MERAETMVLTEQMEMTEPMTELLVKRVRTEIMVLTQQMEMTELMTMMMAMTEQRETTELMTELLVKIERTETTVLTQLMEMTELTIELLGGVPAHEPHVRKHRRVASACQRYGLDPRRRR